MLPAKRQREPHGPRPLVVLVCGRSDAPAGDGQSWLLGQILAALSGRSVSRQSSNARTSHLVVMGCFPGRELGCVGCPALVCPCVSSSGAYRRIRALGIRATDSLPGPVTKAPFPGGGVRDASTAEGRRAGIHSCRASSELSLAGHRPGNIKLASGGARHRKVGTPTTPTAAAL